MKKALVLGLAMIFGLGLFASAQSLTGTWYGEATITGFPSPISVSFTSKLTVNYTVGGWTFTSYSVLGSGGWSDQTFSASGALGAFSFSSLVDFDPSPPGFDKWNVTAGLSLGGMTLGLDWTLTGPGGTHPGLAVILTGSGSTGIVDITIAVGFGDPATPACDLDWQDVKITAGFPFCCADVASTLYFTCDGFEYATFAVTGIALPNFPWLTLDATLKFELQTKTLTLSPKFNFGADVCFDLYYDVAKSGGVGPATVLTLGDITFSGIGLTCEIGGVSFTGISYWGTGTKPGILKGTDYWEAYKIATTDTGCCGPFTFDLTVFFDDTHVNLFDIDEFDANMTLQVSDQFKFGMGFVYDVTGGLTKWLINFTVTW